MSAAVIRALKSVFSRHGIPETVQSDNGPQYLLQEFVWFASSYAAADAGGGLRGVQMHPLLKGCLRVYLVSLRKRNYAH